MVGTAKPRARDGFVHSPKLTPLPPRGGVLSDWPRVARPIFGPNKIAVLRPTRDRNGGPLPAVGKMLFFTETTPMGIGRWALQRVVVILDESSAA